MIWGVEPQSDVRGEEGEHGDPGGGEGAAVRFVGDGDGPVLRGGTGEGVIDEALVEVTGGFVGLRFVLEGGEQQRIERGMLLLDEPGDLAISPDIPATLEVSDECQDD